MPVHIRGEIGREKNQRTLNMKDLHKRPIDDVSSFFLQFSREIAKMRLKTTIEL